MTRPLLLVLVFSAGAAAYQPTLDLQAINEAVALGQSRIEAVRTQFHERYRVRVRQPQPPVDYVDIVTPFRRVVIAAEERARIGDRQFGQREAIAMLGDRAQVVELFIELTFHPLNTYLGVPAYDVHIVAAGTSQEIPSRRIDRVPRYGARVEGMPFPYPYPAVPAPPARSQPLLGGTLVVQFDTAVLNPTGTYDVVVVEMKKEVARLKINLATLR